MGDAERRFVRRLNLKLGLALAIVLAFVTYFAWRDWTEGRYSGLILPVVALAGALRSLKRFRRPRPNCPDQKYSHSIAPTNFSNK
jgi:hypothetical protein